MEKLALNFGFLSLKNSSPGQLVVVTKKYFYVSKKKTSHTFLIVFKFVKSL